MAESPDTFQAYLRLLLACRVHLFASYGSLHVTTSEYCNKDDVWEWIQQSGISCVALTSSLSYPRLMARFVQTPQAPTAFVPDFDQPLPTASSLSVCGRKRSNRTDMPLATPFPISQLI